MKNGVGIRLDMDWAVGGGMNVWLSWWEMGMGMR